MNLFQEKKIEISNELNKIFLQIQLDSKSNSQSQSHGIKLLCIYINKNRNKSNEIIQKISLFLNNENLSVLTIINIINSIQMILTENNHIITFLKLMLPILNHLINHENKELILIDKILEALGNLIKLGEIYTRQIIENLIDSVFEKLSKSVNKYKIKYSYINLLIKIIKNSPTVSYNKIIEKNNSEIILKILNYYQDSELKIRESIGTLIESFSIMFNNRGEFMKHNFYDLIYKNLFNSYKKHLEKNDNIPHNTNFSTGFILIIISSFQNSYFKNEVKYRELCEIIMKNTLSKNTNIKIYFFKVLSILAKINPNIFEKDYSKKVFDYIKSNLNPKDAVLRRIIIKCIGELINILSYNSISPYLNDIIKYLKILVFERKKNYEVIFECLSQFLNNQDGVYLEDIIKNFDIYLILPRMFLTGITNGHLNFILKLLSIYHDTSNQHIFILIIVLNAISFLICNENFEIVNFNNNLNTNIPNLNKYIEETKKNVNNYLKEFKDSNNEDLLKTIYFSLSLISQITNKYFIEDIFIFYYEKILKYLNLDFIEIKKKTIELSNSPFMKIYPNNKNLSLFIMNSILDSFLNLIINDNDNEMKYYCLNILSNNTNLISIFYENKIYLLKIISFLSIEDNKIRELSVKLIGNICKYNNEDNYNYITIRKTILTIIDSIQNLDDIIKKEDQVLLLYYLTLYSKDLFDDELLYLILRNIIFLIKENYLNPIINSNSLKIFSEFINEDFYKTHVIDINEEYFNLIFKTCIQNLQEGINSYNINISLKTILNIIKIKRVNLYDNLPLVNLLYEILINDLNENNFKEVLNIFNYCGFLSPENFIKLNFKISKSSKKKNLYNFEDLINNNPRLNESNCQSVICLMNILKENIQKELSIQIITCLNTLITSLEREEDDLINIILSTMIEIIPNYEFTYVNYMFENMILILENFPKTFKNNINDFIHLIKNYIFDENYNEIILKLMVKIIDQFPNEIKKYYSILIPIFLKLIKQNSKETKNVIYCITLISNNDYISSYLILIFDEIFFLYKKTKDYEIIDQLLDFINQILNIKNSFLYFPIIIQNLIEKLKIDNLDEKIILKCFDIFNKMNSIDRNYFIVYLPKIIQIIKEKKLISQYYLIIKNLIYDINYKSINEKELIEKLKTKICTLNMKLIQPKEINYSEFEIINKRQKIKTRNINIDNNLILNKFQTKNRKEEDDWKEWFKSTSKALFEQSIYYNIYFCHMIVDYNIPLNNNDLYNYAFISVWTNLSDFDKIQIIKELNFALEDNKTPNYILLTILNLDEFMGRKKGNFLNLSKLGKIAYKCKSYAKAIYYKENEFIFNQENNINNNNIFEELIDLYYKLNLSESAFGLLSIFLKNKINKNEYNLFIKIHEYKKGLDSINDILKNENNLEQDKKDILTKDKIICLNGLCDWEEILNINLNANLKEEIDINFIFAKASLNLSNWENLEKYNKNIINYYNRISNSKNLSFEMEDNNINEDHFFDYYLYNSIISIIQNNYKNANDNILICEENINSKIKFLINESYSRYYELMIKNQIIFQLKEIIKFKSENFNDLNYKNDMINHWNKRLNLIEKNPLMFEKLLSIRSLVLNMNEDYENYLKLSKIYRKLNQFEQSKKVLERMKNKLNNLNIEISNDIKISIELNYNKCLFEEGKTDIAISNTKKIIVMIEKENNNISNIIKSKIYGSYGIFNYKLLKLDNKDLTENILNYLQISIQYNQKNYNAWHNFAMLNNAIYEYLIEDNNLNNINNNNNLNYATNAILGFTNSILIKGNNINKILQDILRLIDLFFRCGSSSKEIQNLIKESFNNINIECFLDVIPQLICRIDIGDKNLFEILKNLLIKIGKYHLKNLAYHLIVLNNYKSKKRKEASENILKILSNLNKENENLIKEWIVFINELNRCALLLDEEWFEIIEECFKYINDTKNINKFISKILPLHNKLKKKPETIYEINFYQKYKNHLDEAEEYLKNYLETKDIINIKLAYDIYYILYQKIKSTLNKFNKLHLESISPKLNNIKESKISIPSTKKNSNILISKINPIFEILKTKQHPRKIYIYGNDGKEYIFLLKGHEDLRQDERVMQLFNLINSLFSNDKNTNNKNLNIQNYTVLPLSYNTGILSWVKNCDTMNDLIIEQRNKNNIPLDLEYKFIYSTSAKYDSLSFLNKTEIFKESLNLSKGNELNKIIYIKSLNNEKYLEKRTNFSRSLAVMSIVGYILGLGDRHPNNLMMEKQIGKIIHIDFGDCFEVCMKRKQFPEKIPFRLTKMCIKALDVSGIEGNFRIICESVMKILRNNKNSVLDILRCLIYDPLVSFKFMIPFLEKKFQVFDNDNIKYNNNNFQEKQINNNNFDYKEKSIFNIKDNIKKDNLNKNIFNYESNKENNNIINDEKQILMLLEERDEIENEEINKIAKLVFERIKDKLSGTDFNKNIIYDYKTQVQKLINQATSNENLAQCYIGWCPFW